MTGRDVLGLVLTLAALAIAGLMIATTPAPSPEEPTDAPSGERAYACAEDDRACNERIDVQGGTR